MHKVGFYENNLSDVGVFRVPAWMRQEQEPNEKQSRPDPEWLIHYLWVIWAQAAAEAGEPVFPDMSLPWTYEQGPAGSPPRSVRAARSLSE